MAAIHEAINKAMAQIAQTGIAKTSKASMGGSTVWFRGIEAAMNEMSGVLIKCGITVTPNYHDLFVTERARAEAGKFTRFCTLRGEFTFSAADGSSVTSAVYGEAMDSGDKAVVKAQSVANISGRQNMAGSPTGGTAEVGAGRPGRGPVPGGAGGSDAAGGRRWQPSGSGGGGSPGTGLGRGDF